MGAVNMSKVLGVPSRMDELVARQMGNINTARAGEERGAQRLYDDRLGWADEREQETGRNYTTNMGWATAQQEAAEAALQQALAQRNQAMGMNLTNFLGNTGGIRSYLNSIAGNIGGYNNALGSLLGEVNQYTANPTDLSSFNANPYDISMQNIQDILAGAMGGGNQQVAMSRQPQSVNIQNKPLIDELYKNQSPGGSLYTA
jgi:hypothetical protein